MSNDTGDFTSLEAETGLPGAAPEDRASVKDSAKEAVASLKAAAGSAKTMAAAAAGHAKETGEQWREQAGAMAGQAADTARAVADTAKDRTGSALHGLSKLISDTAETVDARLGPQYGDYARQAAESVAGAARTLDEKDVNELLEEARDFVRKSPGRRDRRRGAGGLRADAPCARRRQGRLIRARNPGARGGGGK